MCQSVAEGGRRCPTHRHDTRTIIKVLQAREGANYSSSIYQAAFLNLRRVLRGATLPDRERQLTQANVNSEMIGSGLLQADQTDAHPSDNITLLAQNALVTHGVISPETDRYICTLINTENDAISRRIFSYLYNESAGFPDPTEAESSNVRRRLLSLGGKLHSDPKAVKVLALLESGHFHVIDPEMADEVAANPPTMAPRIPNLTNAMGRHSPVVRVGYDPETSVSSSRLELILRDDLDTRLVYQNVTESQYDTILDGGPLAAATVAAIRLSPDCHYESPEQAAAAGLTENLAGQNEHCQNCGQFLGSSFHACPAMRINPLLYSQSNIPEPEASHIDVPLEVETPESASVVQVESSRSIVDAPERMLPLTPEEQVYPSAQELVQNVNMTTLAFPAGTRLYEYWVSNLPVSTQQDLVNQGIFTSLEEIQQSSTRAFAFFHHSEGMSIQRVAKVLNSPDEVVTAHGRYLHSRPKGRVLPEGDDWEDHYGVIPAQVTRITQNATASSDISPVVSTRRLFQPRVTSEGLTVSESPSRGDADRWKFGRARELKRALEAGETVVVPFHHEFAAGRLFERTAFVDAQGWEVESKRRNGMRAITTTGSVALRKNANGVVEIEGVESLHCSDCSNSNCTHLGYSLRQTPYIAQDTLNSSGTRGTPARARRNVNPDTGLPVSLENVCTVTRNEEGLRTISFPRSRVRRFSWHESMLLRASQTNVETRDMFHVEMAAPNATLLTRAVRNLSAGESVVVPVEANLHPVSPGLPLVPTLHSQRVSGTLSYGKDDEGQPILKTQDLRCNCEVYARNYSCRHTRRITDGAMSLLANSEEQETITSLYHEGMLNQMLNNRSARENLMSAAALQDQEALQGVALDLNTALSRTVTQSEMNYDREQTERAYRTRQLEVARLNANQARIEEERRVALERRAAYSVQRTKMAERYANPDGPDYSEDYEAFETKVAEIQERLNLGLEVMPYRTVNVLNGIGDDDSAARKFGIELEVVFPDGDSYEQKVKIAQALRDEGLADRGSVGAYHSGRSSGWAKWTAEEDGTVDLEVVSPLMKDTPEDWAQLQRVVEIIKENGGDVNNATGSHVHISTGDYGRNVAPHAALIQQVAQNADVLYRLGSNSKTKTHRGTYWCKPSIIEDGEEITAGGRESYGTIARYLRAPHMSGVNFEGSGDGSRSHAEIRIWDGSLDIRDIQMQVMVTAALAEKAAQDTHTSGIETDDRFTYTHTPGVHQPLGTGAAGTFTNKEEETRSFRRFITDTFPRHSDREIVIAAFLKGKWQKDQRTAGE